MPIVYYLYVYGLCEIFVFGGWAVLTILYHGLSMSRPWFHRIALIVFTIWLVNGLQLTNSTYFISYPLLPIIHAATYTGISNIYILTIRRNCCLAIFKVYIIPLNWHLIHDHDSISYMFTDHSMINSSPIVAPIVPV